MYRSFIIIVLLLISNAVFGQDKVRQQAAEMGNALMKKDYAGFVVYAYPQIVKEMGGKEKMAASIRQQMEGIEKNGAQIIDLSYGEPSRMIKEKKELQCTIPQIMTLKVGGGKVLAKSTIIALSQDNGEHWFFVDSGDRDLSSVRVSLPNISRQLVLPAPQAPQFVKE